MSVAYRFGRGLPLTGGLLASRPPTPVAAPRGGVDSASRVPHEGVDGSPAAPVERTLWHVRCLPSFDDPHRVAPQPR